MSSTEKQTKARVRKNSDEELTTSGYQKRFKIDEDASHLSVECPAEGLWDTTIGKSSMRPETNIDSEEKMSQDDELLPNIPITCSSPELTQNEVEDLRPEPTLKEYYAASGLKLFLPGISYQSKLLIHFLKCGLNRRLKLNRGKRKRYSFALATEMNAAEKFDDIVFRYKKGNGQFVYRFFQAKHKQSSKTKITRNDFLNQKDDDFSLQKYFISFLRIKKNPLFENCKLRDFTICTNISLEESLENSFESLYHEDDEILNFEGVERLKLNYDEFPEKGKLKSVLENASDCRILAKRLAKYAKDGEIISFKDSSFKLYHRALRKYVIEVKDDAKHEGKYVTANFYKNFVDGLNLPPSANNFRNVFFQEYRGPTSVLIKISYSFVKFYDLNTNPIIADVKPLADVISTRIKEAEEGVVNLDRKNRCIRNHIDKLAGFVFIKKDTAEKDTYYFGRTFLDDNNLLPGNIKSFREELLKHQNKNELSKFRFHITEFLTCEEGELCSQPDLPDDINDVSETEMRDFFGKLVFAVNLPNEIELGRIIENDMSEQFNLKDSKLLTSGLETFIQNWMKDKNGYFLTDEDGEIFFKEVEHQISTLKVHGITSEYFAKIEAFGMDFSNVPPKLESFLNSTDKRQIFNLISSCEVTTLSVIKVIRALKNKETCYIKDGFIIKDSFISLQLCSILVPHVKVHVTQAFGSKVSNNLLIIECGAAEGDRQQLFESLASIIKDNYEKKIMFITHENDTLVEKFKNHFPEHKWDEEVDEKNSLIDLKEDSQEELWNRKLFKFLEGETDLSLGLLVDKVDEKSKYLIARALEGKLLFKLIRKEMIKIGKAPKDQKYDDTKYYFIERSFYCYINVNKRFKEDKLTFFVIDKKQDIVESSVQEVQDLIIIADTKDEFQTCCNDYNNNNIHWLKNVGSNFIWQQSRGSVSKLRKFIEMREQSRAEYKPQNLMDLPDGVVLITAEAGMGKSVILSHLAVNTPSIPFPSWIVRCNLIDYSFKFAKWKESSGEKLDTNKAVKFLYKITQLQLFEGYKNEIEEAEKEQLMEDYLVILDNGKVDFKSDQLKQEKEVPSLLLFEVELFTQYYNQGNITILLDGFDEISPNYKYKVLELIETLKNYVAKIWITTRPLDIRSEVENRFGTFSYELKPFTPYDQNNFLQKFWAKKLKPVKLNKQSCNVYADELLKMFSHRSNDLQKSFVSVPLQIYMIAEIFWAAFEEFHESANAKLSEEEKKALDEKLNLNSLYEKFTLEKYRVERKKADANYDRNRCKVENSRTDVMQYKKFLKLHRRLAVIVTFEGEYEKYFPNVIDSIEQLEEGDLKTGIIQRIAYKKPIFIHQTFAEYFTADLLWEKFKSIQYNDFERFIDDIIFGNLIRANRMEICAFLKSKAEKDLESNVDFSSAEKKLENLMEKFLGGEFSLKLSIFFLGGEFSLKLSIFRYIDKAAHEDSLFVLFWIMETALRTGRVCISRVIKNLESGFQYNLLVICAQIGYVELAKALIRTETDSKTFLQHHLTNYGWGGSILSLAIVAGHVSIAQHFAKLYDISSWKDGEDRSFMSTVSEYTLEDFECLTKIEFDGFDVGKPYFDCQYGEQRLLLFEVFHYNESDTIKFLMGKTDNHVIVEFSSSCRWDEFFFYPSVFLYQFDEEILQLALDKGMDFCNSINIVLHNIVEGSLAGEDFQHCLKLNDLILRSGAMYNCKNIKISGEKTKYFVELFDSGFDIEAYSRQRECRRATLHYSECIYLFSTLLCKLKKLSIDDNPDIFCLINELRVRIIKSFEMYPNFKGFEIIPESQRLCLSPNVGNDSHAADLFIECKIHFFFLAHKLELNDTTSTASVLTALNEVYSFINGVKKQTDYFNTYPYCLSDNSFIHTSEDDLIPPYCHSGCAISESERIHKENQFFTLSARGKFLLQKLILLSKNISYKPNIGGLCKEISKEVLLWSKWKHSQGIVETLISEKMLFKTNDVLQILEADADDGPDEELQHFVSRMEECGAEYLIRRVLRTVTLCLYGNSSRWKLGNLDVELMLKKSKQFHELLITLDEVYKNLITAIRNKSYEAIESILKQEPDYKKSIIHGQDETYGSPLHYVASKGDVESAKILLSHGANPNLRLNETGIPEQLATFDNSERMECNDDWSLDYYSWTPLHLAALNGHDEIVQLLIDNGAKIDIITDVEAINKGDTPLHLSTLRDNLSTVRLLLKNGACYDAKNAQNKTPLELAKSGSDVAEILRCVNQSFQAVKECRKYSVCSLLMKKDSDSLKAILHAKNSDKKTLLCVARANELDDMVDLLEEMLKSSSIEPPFSYNMTE